MGRESYEIDVRLRDADRASLRDLYDFRIITSRGHQVPGQLVAVEQDDAGEVLVREVRQAGAGHRLLAPEGSGKSR